MNDMIDNVTEAMEEISLIKKVIDRTQNDFSKIADFFISIGIMNLVVYILYAVLLQVIRGMEQVSYPVWMLLRGLNYISVIGYIILFWAYHRRLKQWNNRLSLGLINLWGVLLIGGEAFRIFFSILYHGEQSVYFYQKTLTFLFPVIGCLVLGFIIQDRLIQRVTFAVIILYMILAGMGIEVRVAEFHGNDMKAGLDMFLTAAVVSVGMILLGMDLKGKGEK